MKIAFSGVLMDSILAKIPLNKPAEFSFFGSKKCITINNKYLLMPLMMAE
jgi:hypothetical protein